MASSRRLATGLVVAFMAASLASLSISNAETDGLYEATPRYNVLPWWFTLDKLFAFPLLPINKSFRPTNPLTYLNPNYPQWPFVGGPGYIIAIKFSDSPIGAYNEMFFIPGQYKPSCSLMPYFSVQRIWVDSMHSRHAGRSIWGIPKEMATFKWEEDSDGKWTALTLTDNAANKVAFHANMTDVELPGDLEVSLPSWVLPSNVRKVVQWPIDDSDYTFLPSTEAFASTNISQYTNMKTGVGMKPVLTELTFQGEDATAATVSDIYIDGELMTGHRQAKLNMFPLSVHLHKGTKASLSAPVVLQPKPFMSADACAAKASHFITPKPENKQNVLLVQAGSADSAMLGISKEQSSSAELIQSSDDAVQLEQDLKHMPLRNGL